MKNKKGFILIKILLIIVLLSVAAVIAVPIILNNLKKEPNDSPIPEETIKYREFNFGEHVFFNPVTYSFCEEEDTNKTCYEWIVISRINNEYEFLMLDNENEMKWSESISNPVDIIKTYTNNWSDKLKVDSSHDYTYSSELKFEFSKTKARMYTKEEYDKHKTIQSEIEEACYIKNYCTILNNTDKVFALINAEGITSTVPYSDLTSLKNSFIKPVIKVDVTKGIENAKLDNVYKKYKVGDAVYFDPVTTNKCDSNLFNVNSILNGTSTCYKWYVISTGDNVSSSMITIQLDHNLVNKSAWSSSSTKNGPKIALTNLSKLTSKWSQVSDLNYQYDTSLAQKNYGKLICTDGICKINNTTIATNVKARIITGEEIAKITKKAGATNDSVAGTWRISSPISSYYFFSNKDYEIGTMNEGTNDNSLKWLIENTENNSSSGATSNEYSSMNNGYLTLSPVSDSDYNVWSVSSAGLFSSGNSVSNDASYGLRPVITIEKNKIN